jgi:HAD superfamily hydrolase (TIGR01509 family)
VIFDMGNVLYDATLWRRWLARLLSRLVGHVDYDSIRRVWDRYYLVDVHRGRREHAEAFQEYLLSTGLSWAQIDEVVAASHIERQELEADARPFPGVAATLAKLHAAGLALALVADAPCPATQLEARLHRLGLGGRFRAVLSSFDLEAIKPAPECYRAALRALDLEAHQAAFVGYDAESLAGATAAGLRTAAFNYESHARADVYLARFDELIEAIDAWSASPAPLSC